MDLPVRGTLDADEQQVLDLSILRQHASLCLSRTCTEAQKLTHGRSYDIFVMSFDTDENHASPSGIEDERWSCIARVSRSLQPTALISSEVETMRYIKSRASIPVPDVYFFEPDANNPIGAQIMLIERLPGVPLNQVWDLSMTKNRLCQILRRPPSSFRP
jgi:hypothetical protein